MRPPLASSALRGRAVAALAKLPLERALRLLGRWRGVLVLNHHRVGDPTRGPWDGAMYSATAGQLDRELGTLARLTQVIGPQELAEAVHAGPGRRVLITFDDGYRDNHELALPLLCAHGLTATFFLASGFLDEPRAPWWDEIAWMVGNAGVVRGDGRWSAGGGEREPPDRGRAASIGERRARIQALVARCKALAGQGGEVERFLQDLADELGSGRCPPGRAAELWMTWEQARELRAAGMTIGGHTVTHPVLAGLPREGQRAEIAGCARRLQEELGEPMRWFAYPVGAPGTFTTTTAELLRECGVELAFSFYGGFAAPARWDPFDVPRVHVDAALAPRLLLQRTRTVRATGRR